ncbi:M20 family metallopeptidase [Aerococcaceae bacterium zg-ZUI334]|uniref:M20 family metallopeptidase n=1 Tax=Aerococcaceae TaxID=186827 RepID=UPI0013BD8977|nr:MULTISPECIES: M20 family metallopeptidase [unclassified Facklamia]MBR7927127.1 M20 family metallopeptidase [Aerococcaceae bacterium zg-ZUI334]NEW63545.1 amidohydrolase [Facklamia sp. 252]NEW67016.1 amidohydrolase [Facklamia sp. 253]QQD66435.1 M20 family metallopeptidase [Aerococcaceae bacterium zg-252]
MQAREIILQSVDAHVDDYMQIVKTLYDNPEIGNEEFESMAVLVDYLTKAGFDTQAAYILPTAFLATYDTHKPGPTIAFMCEYDALPEVGHGCGHNLIAAIGVAAGEALKSVIDQYGGKVLVVGTPAEENFGGKVSLANAGVFDEVDVALMVHPGTRNGVGGRSNALYPLKFEFFGKNAHACRPAEGASALDAAVMSYVQINLLRQFVAPHTYIHGVISDGGKAANVIPGYAAMEYYFRAPTISYAKEVAAKAVEMVEGVCAANGTTFETSVYECPYEDTVINYRLAELLTEQYQSIGVTDIEPVDEIATGSTDVGAVSYKCPTIQGFIKIADEHVQAHSKEMADATLSEQGRNGLIKAAQGIALTALYLLENPTTLAQVKLEQDETLAKINQQ